MESKNRKTSWSIAPWRTLREAVDLIEDNELKHKTSYLELPYDEVRRRYVDAAIRHLVEYMEDCGADRDSGMSPLVHAIARLMLLRERELFDDEFNR